MRRSYLLIALFALVVLFGNLHAYWSEKMDVYVIDRTGRAINNATVTVVYQSTRCGLHDQITKSTGEDGKAHFEFINTVDETFNPKCIERSYTVTGSFLGLSNTTGGSVDASSKTYFISLPAVTYRVRVVDTAGDSLYPSFASYGALTFASDQSGTINIPIAINKQESVYVNYGGIGKMLSVQLAQEKEETIQLPVYDVRVKLFDEKGSKIEGTVTIDNETQSVSAGSDAVFPKFSYSKARFIISSRGVTKALDLSVTSDSLSIYFDFSAPSIREVEAQPFDRKNVKVTASVFDDGTFSSGLASNPEISYSFGDESMTGKMFPSGFRSFEATIPARGLNTVFTIKVLDNQGNSATYQGGYNFTKTDGPKNDTVSVFQISPAYIIGLIIIIAVVIFVYWRIREQI